MALNDVTISFDLNQLLGADFDANGVKAYVKTNVINQTLMDTSTGEIRLGQQRVTIEADGTGSFTTWGVGLDGNPTSWQTSLVVNYRRAGSRDRVDRTFGPYAITDADNGKTLAEMEDQQAIPPNYQTAFTADMEVIRDEAEAARDAAVDISNIDTSDGVVSTLIEGTAGAGPLTRSALSASTDARIASEVPPLVVDVLAADPTVADAAAAAVTEALVDASVAPAEELTEDEFGVRFDDGDYFVRANETDGITSLVGGALHEVDEWQHDGNDLVFHVSDRDEYGRTRLRYGVFEDGTTYPPTQIDAADFETRSVTRPSVVFPGRKVLNVSGESFYIKGVNLGLRSTNSFYESWLTGYDEAWFFDGLDKIRDAGFNTVRIVGSYSAYATNPAQFKARLHAQFERARDNGLKVIFSALNVAGLNNDPMDWAANGSAFQAMFTNLCADYYGDDLILVWDVGNELPIDQTATATVIQNFAPWIKTQDPTTLVTASQTSEGGIEGMMHKITLVEPYVDVVQLHWYAGRSYDYAGKGALAQIANQATKPIYIGEFGCDDYTGGAGPRVGGQFGQASHYAAFMAQVVDADVCGLLFWKIKDVEGTPTRMGLFDEDGVPRKMLDQAMRFPDRNMAPVREYVDRRPHPVLLDNFDRAPSATVLGDPDLGSSPTVITGTWGINSSFGGGYASTKNGTVSDKVVWPCKTLRTPLFEAEFSVAQATSIGFGLLFHWSDPDNYWFYSLAPAADPEEFRLSLTKVLGGVATEQAGSTDIPLAATGDYPRRVRLGVRLTNDRAECFYDGHRILPQADIIVSGSPPRTTTRGVFLAPADTTSKIAAVRAYIDGAIG